MPPHRWCASASLAVALASLLVFLWADVALGATAGVTGGATFAASTAAAQNTSRHQALYLPPVFVCAPDNPINICISLTDLYYSLNGPGWRESHSHGWREAAVGVATNYCTFGGLLCDSEGTLNSMILSGQGLNGTLPTSLGYLSSLTRLEFSDEPHLIGAFPDVLGALTRLTSLKISNTGLGGPVTPELRRLSSLQVLELRDNPLQRGPAPATLNYLTQLNWLWLGGNDMVAHELSFLDNMTKLSSLRLINGGWTGPFPPALLRMPDLLYLILAANSFTGPIGPALSGIGTPRLETLCVRPHRSLGRAVRAATLTLASRRRNVSGNSFDGTVPTAVATLTKLLVLCVAVVRWGRAC